MYGLSGEHILILAIVLLLFGPRRLPGLGHSIGRTMKTFKDGMNGLKDPEPAQKPAPSLLEKKSAPAAAAPAKETPAEQETRA